MGPVVLVYPDGVFYQNVTIEDVHEIVEEHLLKGRIVNRLVSHAPGTDRSVAEMEDVEFFNRQVKIVLRNSGIIDPLKIEEYIAREGYQALAKVLTEMKPEEVVSEVLRSGLRGRGGAGFPTGLKWKFARQTESDVKYILCNADEGDPGAFMDRSVLEGDPHSLIEGMAIGAYAIGAKEGFVYLRAEYPLAVERLQYAIDQAREMGLLGKDIMGTGFEFDLEIRMGSGAFVCGEETALMRSIEGGRGEPRPRPPFPAVKGLWDKPSVLNNVETFANIAPIILKGAEWYASTGTEKSKGTKVFALGGAIQHAGLVEVPIGVQLGEIVYEIGGGVPNGKELKAVQLGGPSGGCIPKGNLNVPVDYETLQELGAIMGSGGCIVMDDDSCMVDVARYFLDFIQDESCGKCPPCRVGTKRMLEIVTRICNGEGQEGDIEALEDLGNIIKDTALCGLGQTAANPVLSTIRHFRHEYEAHIKDHYCEAGVCSTHVHRPVHQRLPGQRERARLREPHRREALRRGPQAAPGTQPAGQHLRPGLLPSLREQVPARLPRRGGGHPQPQAVHDRAGDRGPAARGARERRERSPQDRRRRQRAGRPLLRVLPGPPGLQAHHLREGAELGRHAGAGHPGLPVAARRAGPRDQHDREHGRRPSRRAWLSARTSPSPALKDQGYDAVFLGVGAPAGMPMGIPGEDGPGVTEGLTFLREYNVHGTAEVGTEVAVVGGGNSAIDAARTALRLGAKHVNILYRRQREQMPAWAEEILAADEEGITVLPLTSPKEILRDAARQGHRRALPADGSRRLRQERPAGAGGRAQPRLHGGVRPGDRRHRPVARRQGPRRRPAGGAEPRLVQDRSQHRRDQRRLALRRRRRGHRPGLGRGGRRRRRAGRGGHRPAPDRRQPRLLAQGHRRSTCSSIPTPIPSPPRAPRWSASIPRRAPAPSTRWSCPGTSTPPAPRPSAACAATTARSRWRPPKSKKR